MFVTDELLFSGDYKFHVRMNAKDLNIFSLFLPVFIHMSWCIDTHFTKTAAINDAHWQFYVQKIYILVDLFVKKKKNPVNFTVTKTAAILL